jgi:S-adenosylmethionine-dependent methyltransferase
MNQHSKPDQSFDSIANKFEENIYGTTKGKLRHDLLMYHMLDVLSLDDNPLTVYDAGGGTGTMSKSLVDMGHKLIISDISSDALTLARKKFVQSDKIEFVHGDILSVENDQSYDLVVCHAVLEWLKSPLEMIDSLVKLLKPGGHLSLSFFNKDAQRFGNLLYGNFDFVKAGMQVKNRVRLSPNNALDPRHVLDRLDNLPVTVIHKAGIRCFHDYLRDPNKQVSHYQQLKEMELTYGKQEPYLWLGKYFHIIVQKQLKS